jgi:hypothetical protein
MLNGKVEFGAQIDAIPAVVSINAELLRVGPHHGFQIFRALIHDGRVDELVSEVIRGLRPLQQERVQASERRG